MIHNNNEPKPNPYGTDAHDGSFEGSCTLYAKHLVEDHGFPAGRTYALVGSSQSDWSNLDRLHRYARSLDDAPVSEA